MRLSATADAKWWINMSKSQRTTYLRKYYFSSGERMKKRKSQLEEIYNSVSSSK